MNKLRANLQIPIHVGVWLAILLSPLVFFGNRDGEDIGEYIINGMIPLTLLIVLFYANFFYLVPKHYLGGKKRVYWIGNLIMIVAFALATHIWLESHDKDREPEPVGMMPQMKEPGHKRDRNKPLPDRPEQKPPEMRRPSPDEASKVLFIFRDLFNLCFSAAAATFVVVLMKWRETDEARKKAEAARTEAELKNLRNQINPHFLLNTLNNIYALTAFDTGKAQEAIHELSSMLRHLLYDNQQRYVSLTDEIAFLRNYIDLMKIRLTDNVEVSTDINIPKHCDIRIAPLLFISLVENAFKHGISPVKHSFIHIKITADESGKVECLIENSNHPKDAGDRSGHGIGLQQVEQRLDMSYKGLYEWTKGLSADNSTYTSKITIYDTTVHDN